MSVAWTTLELDYLFLDGFHASRCTPVPGPSRCWPRGASPPMGKPVLVGLAAGGARVTDAWATSSTDLGDRGLRPPLLVISDGAGRADQRAETVLARSLRQRCLIHRAATCWPRSPPSPGRAQVPPTGRSSTPTTWTPTAGGPKLVAAVQHRIDAFAVSYGPRYPAAVRCLLADRDQLTSYLRFPTEHRHRIRHSNFIERTFGETRRRVKVIGRLPGETSCLNLVWAVLDRASRGWRGVTLTPTGTRLLADLRHQLLDPPTPIRKPNTNINDAETVGAVA